MLTNAWSVAGKSPFTDFVPCVAGRFNHFNAENRHMGKGNNSQKNDKKNKKAKKDGKKQEAKSTTKK